MDNRLNYDTKKKNKEDLRGKPISNMFSWSDIQHRRSDKIFLRGEGGEVMEKFEIKNNFYNFLCLVISI